MDLKSRFYPESRFGGFSSVDGTVQFYMRVNVLLNPSFEALDVGCGRGAYGDDPVLYRRNLRLLRGKVKRLTGLDIDPTAESNPFIDRFLPLTGPTWPIEPASIDFILADHVLEHLADPEAFFAEACRVLKPGGYFCFRTPNLWSYVALASRLAPNRIHANLLKDVKPGTRSVDVFPTHYRINTLPSIRRLAARAGFTGLAWGHGPEPSYLAFSPLAYALGVLYQRVIPGLFQPVIFGFFQKTDH